MKISYATIRDYPEITSKISACFPSLANFSNYLTNIAEGQRPKHIQSVHILLCKTIETTSAAYDSILEGRYISSLVLIRSAYESQLFMQYLNKHPESAEKWIEEDNKPNTDDIINDLFSGDEKLMNANLKFYGELCKTHHPKLSGCARLLLKPISDDKAYIMPFPTYDYKLASDSFVSVSFVLHQTLKAILSSFQIDDKSVHQDIKDRLREMTEITNSLRIQKAE